MSTLRTLSRFSTFFLVAAGGMVAGRRALRHLLERPLPQLEGTLELPGLKQSVQIIRDRWGVPHIYAQTEHDLFFAQGFVHAQDRLFQMDANRRLGTGRIGEIVGPAGLAADRMARIFGWHLAAEAQARGIMQDPDSRAAAEAYAAGVNAFIAGSPLPIEFTLLAYRPEPWHVRDSAAWGSVLAWGLSANWATELIRAQLLSKLGPERAADLNPECPENYPTILPTELLTGHVAAALHDAYQQALQHLPLGDLPTSPAVGSNNWVLSGDRTATGRPILANDPHLPPLSPPIWYENHLCAGRYNVTGFTTPGVPGVVLGHNQHIAWGLTNAFPDVQDLYVERFHPGDPLLYEVDGQWQHAELRREEINVRGRRRPVVEEIRHTRHGPVISALLPDAPAALALSWTSLAENNHLRAVLELCRAHDWTTFRAALQHWAFPPQNVVYADTAGHIGYTMPGRIPRRAQGHGLVLVPGHTRDHDWQGWLPFDELPCCFDPPEGFVVTANNRVTGDDYPHLLTGEWLPPYRAQRIRDLLLREPVHTIESCARIQQDTVSLLARKFMSTSLPLLEGQVEPHPVLQQAYFLLQRWHIPAGDQDAHNMRAAHVAPAIYHSWLVAFTHAVMEQALGVPLKRRLLARPDALTNTATPFHDVAVELAVRWLEQGPPEWVGDVRPLLYPAFRQAVAALQRHLGDDPAGWQWGKLHRLELRHLLTRLPGLGRLWQPLRYPLSGDAYTVNQAEVSPHMPPEPVQIIASCRIVLDVGEWDNSISALPGGQSGHPAAHHYQDGVQDWLHGRYHPMPFSAPAVREAAKHTLQLQPAKR